MIRSTHHRLLTALVAFNLLVTPGCLMGSPLAAFSGEPYGMTADDVSALQGKRSAIWYGAPVFAAIDLPFAFVLDTALLPISLIVWTIDAIVGDDDHEHLDGAPSDHVHGAECAPASAVR